MNHGMQNNELMKMALVMKRQLVKLTIATIISNVLEAISSAYWMNY